MKKLTDFLKGFAIDYVIKYLTDNKEEVVAKLNKEINVPILNEKQEKELLDAVYDTTLVVVKGIKQMIPALIISKVVPKVIDMVLKQFKGIEKIDKLVDYMEKDNEADQKIKLLEKGFMQLADELDELKKNAKKDA